MRKRAVLALAVLVLAPFPSLADGLDCDAMTRSIGHFELQHARAKELDNPMWADKTAEHIAVLKDRRAAACPEYSAEAQAQAQALELMRMAGKAALRYFTFGAF